MQSEDFRAEDLLCQVESLAEAMDAERAARDLTDSADRAKSELLAVVSHEQDPALAKSKLREIYQEITPPLPEDRIEAAIQRLLSPWFRFSVAYDPKETLRDVACPVLALFGELDVQVPPEGNLEAISQALKIGGNTDVTVEVLPGLNHFFQAAQTGSPLEYSAIEETISPSVLQLIADWILERTKANPEAAGRDSARRVETMSSD